MKAPTLRQLQFLRAIHAYSVAHGYAPSIRNIAAAVAKDDEAPMSTNGVNCALTALRRKGLLEGAESYVARATRLSAKGLVAIGVATVAKCAAMPGGVRKAQL